MGIIIFLHGIRCKLDLIHVAVVVEADHFRLELRKSHEEQRIRLVERLEFGFGRVELLLYGIKREENGFDADFFEDRAFEIGDFVPCHDNVISDRGGKRNDGQQIADRIVQVESVVAQRLKHLFFIRLELFRAELAVRSGERGKSPEVFADAFRRNRNSHLFCDGDQNRSLERLLDLPLVETVHSGFHTGVRRHEQSVVANHIHQFAAGDVLFKHRAHDGVRRHGIRSEKNVSARSGREKPDERNDDDGRE